MKQKCLGLLLSFTVATGLIGCLNNRFSTLSVSAQATSEELNLELMTVERLEAILQDKVSNIESKPGRWQFEINNIAIVVIANAEANRMRIVAPITNADDLTAQQVQKMLIANFHTALDARYAVSKGFVVSTFIHPLNSLQETDLLSALNQVASLADTFGTTYSSGELLFLPNGARERRSPPSEGNISI